MAALPADLVIREISALTRIVESGTAHPQPPPSLDEAKAIYKVLLRDLANVVDSKYLLQPALDPARSCSYRSVILKAVLNLGAHDRSVLLRVMALGQLS